ncbi:hypothetical protein HDU84_000955 [Entophlyctis sp. JEL0112]|nr:hypothetical protein HDU84_000955 [Entophlyctis sp. JEL0112]
MTITATTATAPAQTPFADTLRFPAFDALPFHDVPDDAYHAPATALGEPSFRVVPRRHWCFVAEIAAVSFVSRPRVTVLTGLTNPDGSPHTAIVESYSRSAPTTFAWPDLKPGHTIAILYAARRILDDGSIGIRQDDLSSVYIFRSLASVLYAFSHKLCAKQRECFHPTCACKSMLIVSRDSVAAYCSANHQRESMKAGYFKLYTQAEDLMWLVEAVGTSFRSKFGSVVHVPDSARAGMAVSTANQATAAKYSPVSVLSTAYPPGSPVAPVMSLYVCAPRHLTLLSDGKKAFELSIMERHPYTTQTFIPMGLDVRDPETKYLVIVAPDVEGTEGKDAKPDMSKARAFLAHGHQGVTYGQGVWHSPMVVIGTKSIHFAVLMWVNGIARDECTEVEVVTENVLLKVNESKL